MTKMDTKCTVTHIHSSSFSFSFLNVNTPCLVCVSWYSGDTVHVFLEVKYLYNNIHYRTVTSSHTQIDHAPFNSESNLYFNNTLSTPISTVFHHMLLSSDMTQGEISVLYKSTTLPSCLPNAEVLWLSKLSCLHWTAINNILWRYLFFNIRPRQADNTYYSTPETPIQGPKFTMPQHYNQPLYRRSQTSRDKICWKISRCRAQCSSLLQNTAASQKCQSLSLTSFNRWYKLHSCG